MVLELHKDLSLNCQKFEGGGGGWGVCIRDCSEKLDPHRFMSLLNMLVIMLMFFYVGSQVIDLFKY